MAPARNRKPLTLFLSLDVEEEGLFRGVYQQEGALVSNVAHLSRLRPLLERGARPTLFCAHSVLADAESRDRLLAFKEAWGAEIGAHLHHWNTPPLEARHIGKGPLKAVPADAVPLDLLAEKLEGVAELAKSLEPDKPLSFRMGRWDLHARHWPLLIRAGIALDASVRPCHCGKGPDHYAAPANPYWVEAGEQRILEAPLTVTPITRSVAMSLPMALRPALRHCGALALLAVQHPLWLLKLTTLLHVARGGQLLSLTWHSSEMMPGACPHLHDEAAVNGFLTKIGKFMAWLEKNFEVRHALASELVSIFGASAPLMKPQKGDWTSG